MEFHTIALRFTVRSLRFDTNGQVSIVIDNNPSNVTQSHKGHSINGVNYYYYYYYYYFYARYLHLYTSNKPCL
jgi:hypothetical protein